ncbi:MAG: winged helix-turn-helix domain-containing protein [Coriobacteriia bacterium]
MNTAKFPDVDFAKLDSWVTSKREVEAAFSEEYYAYLAEGGLYETFAVLGDRNRMRIMQLLVDLVLPVSEIAALLGLTEANTWYHLKVLRGVGLIELRLYPSGYTIRDYGVSELTDFIAKCLTPERMQPDDGAFEAAIAGARSPRPVTRKTQDEEYNALIALMTD